MQNSYVTLHRTLDTQIQSLESTTHPNLSLITDLKKKKMQLKEHIELGTPLPKQDVRKYKSMIQSNEGIRESKKETKKDLKHAHDEELRRRLSNSLVREL